MIVLGGVGTVQAPAGLEAEAGFEAGVLVACQRDKTATDQPGERGCDRLDREASDCPSALCSTLLAQRHSFIGMQERGLQVQHPLHYSLYAARYTTQERCRATS